MLIFHTGAA